MRLSCDSPEVSASVFPGRSRDTLPSPSISGRITSIAASAEMCVRGVTCMIVGAVPSPSVLGVAISSGIDDVPRRILNTLPTRSMTMPASRASRRITGHTSASARGASAEVRTLTFMSMLGSITTDMLSDSASCSSTRRSSACS